MLQDRIREIRNYYGLSQSQLARKINRSSGFISSLETGRCKASEKTIETLSTVLGINADWIRTGDGEMLSAESKTQAVKKELAGERIRVVRKSAGLTQAEFAAKTGYSKLQVNLVENGKAVPSNNFLQAVIDAFHVDACWLFTGEGDMMNIENSGEVDDELIEWLKSHPEVVRELKNRMI